MSKKNDVFPVDENDTDVMVTIDLDSGESVDCEIVLIFETDESDQNYIALLPVDEKQNPREDLGVLLYRYDEDPDSGEPSIDNILSDEEFDLVSAAYQQLIAEEM